MSTSSFSPPGGTIAFEEAGSGHLVLCVPGLGDLRSEYRFLVPFMVAAGYWVVTMDIRGHGESSVGWPDHSVSAIGSDMLALIRHVGGGPATIVGTSMAAGAAVWASAESPGLVTSIVLIGPFVRDVPSLSASVMRFLTPVLFTGRWGPHFWVMYYRSLYPTSPPPDFEEYLERLRRNLAEPGRLAALRQTLLAPKSASEQRLGKVRVPALVMMGTRDPDFQDPVAEARFVAGAVSGALQLVVGAGHYPHVEMPETAASAILAFLQSLKSPAGP